MENMQRLREENLELKKALVFLMNRSLIRKLLEAMERINSGEYISEKDFFSDSHQ